MSKFEILCVTMHQNDFSKIEKMNIHSDVVFANQADTTSFEQIEFEGHTAKMITTATRGVGVNRNFSLAYASADICLFADDDVTYVDNMEEIVLDEFEKNPKADIMIFHFETDDSQRPQESYSKTKRRKKWQKLPWAGFRIAFRLSAVKKANLNFTTLFGGGCIFPSGEDSMFLKDAVKAGLKIYVSNKTIGQVSFAESTWFTGYDKKYFYGVGAFYQCARKKTKSLRFLYTILRTRGQGLLSNKEKLKWLKYGALGYKKMLSYDQFVKENAEISKE